LEIALRIPAPTDPKPQYIPRNITGIKYEVIRINCPRELAAIKTWIEVNVVNSTAPDDSLESTRDKIGNLYALGSLRVIHNRPPNRNLVPPSSSSFVDNYEEYTETATSIAAVHPVIWEVVQLSQYCNKKSYSRLGMFIEKHQIQARDYASESNPPCVSNLFCIFKEPSFLSVEESMEQMHLKMNNMVECGFLGRDDYTIHNPTYSRDFGAKRRLYCVVIFTKNVSEENRIYIKACLDQTKFRGKIDPNTITEEDPVGKHIPYMCIISWTRVSTMNAIEGKKQNSNFISKSPNVRGPSNRKKY
jgi:hypothetical protein